MLPNISHALTKDEADQSSANMRKAIYGASYGYYTKDGVFVPVNVGTPAANQAALDDIFDDKKPGTYVEGAMTINEYAMKLEKDQIAAQGVINSSIGTLDTSIGNLGTSLDDLNKSVGTNLTGTISGVRTEVDNEGDQTQNTIITMVGRTNKILEHYLAKVPEMVRKGMYNTDELDAPSFETMLMTLPDKAADLTLSNGSMIASINPLDPTNNPSPMTVVNENAQASIIDAFAGTAKIAKPVGQASNKLRYAANLLAKSLYPVVKGSKPTEGSGLTTSSDAIYYKRGAETNIYSKFLAPATVDDNISILESNDKTLMDNFFSNEQIKTAANTFILIKGLEAKMNECFDHFQQDPKAKTSNKDGDSGVSYSVFESAAALKDSDEHKDKIHKMNCGPMILDGTAEIIGNKFGNGWGTITQDLNTIYSTKTSWGNAGKIARGELIPTGENDLFIDCRKNSIVDSSCASLNTAIAGLWNKMHEEFFKDDNTKKISGVVQDTSDDGLTKYNVLKMKNTLPSYKSYLQNASTALYAYLYSELSNYIDVDAKAKITNQQALGREYAPFPSFDNFFNPQSYHKRVKNQTIVKTPTVPMTTSVTTSANARYGLNSTNMLNCVSQSPQFGPPERIDNDKTDLIFKYLSHIAGLSSNPSLDLPQILIPMDYSDGASKFQVVLYGGGFFQLEMNPTSAHKRFVSDSTDKDGKFIAATKKGEATKTTNKRNKFLNDLRIKQADELSKLESIMMSKTSALSNLLFAYDQRSSKYTYTCKSRQSMASKVTADTKVQLTPMEGMVHNTRWRLTNSEWKNAVQSMDKTNLARQQLYLMSEMYEMQFQQYAMLERIMTLMSIQVGQTAATAANMSGMMGDGAKNAADSYLAGRFKAGVGGAAGDKASEAKEGATMQADDVSSSTGSIGNEKKET